MKLLNMFIIFLTIYSFNSCKTVESNEKYIISTDGLVLRDKPDIAGSKLDVIPFGSKVLVLSENNEVVEISNWPIPITGKWTFVNWKDKKGWLFGGYLGDKSNYLNLLEEGNKKEFSKEPIKKKHTGFFKSKDEIFRYYGNPDKIDNKENNSKYSVLLFKYSGIEMEVYYLKERNDYYIKSIIVFDKKYKLNKDIVIGMQFSEIEKIFGKANEQKNNYNKYHVYDSTYSVNYTTYLIFFNYNNVLDRIEVVYPLD